ncbi:MAG TPA: hypothetical protein VEL74_07480 [Thermoanaerobaculia bacterium]|nr:hypothetical protein [Thermoanaerobaculia bacterium]
MSIEQSPDFDGEYGAVQLPEAWHVLSLVCFAGALGSRFLVILIPEVLRSMVHRSWLPGIVTLWLAAIGLALGLRGLRVPAGRSTARVAIFLNAIVVALCLLAGAAVVYIMPG